MSLCRTANGGEELRNVLPITCCPTGGEFVTSAGLLSLEEVVTEPLALRCVITADDDTFRLALHVAVIAVVDDDINH